MNKTKNSSKKILLTAFVVIAMLLIGVISASADESDTCELSLSSTYFAFGSDLPSYYNVYYTTASPVDLTLGLRDCCIRDDVVEVRLNGCHEWTVDSRNGDSGTHPWQYKTFSLPAGSYTIELKNTISSVGPSGWYYDLSTATFTGAYPVPCLNQPPVANAGPDQIVEQTYYQGAFVPLDGSGSTDDGYLWPLTYTWTWPGGSATGVNPTVSLPLGTTTITLVVNDGIDSDSDTVSITVEDTTPPVITCPADVTVEQETADGTVVPLTATATDICDANPTIASDELAIYPLGMTTVTFTATDASGNSASCSMTVTVQDTTPPVPACLETVNPHGNKVPPAGSTTLPGPKGGQNEDGFYELTATDQWDPNPQIFVVDMGSGAVFGPFVSGTTIKYTQNLTATPVQKTIGSSRGRAGAIDWHIIGKGDAMLAAVDFSGNVGWAVCLVPPPPK